MPLFNPPLRPSEEGNCFRFQLNFVLILYNFIPLNVYVLVNGSYLPFPTLRRED